MTGAEPAGDAGDDSSRLPVERVMPQVVAALDDVGQVVLQAPPGAGKTTRVPLALRDRPWRDGRVLVLEPRRLAVRASARRMADLLGESPGGTVGYVTRDDRVVSGRTVVEVVTEGILVRRLQRDPALSDVAAVIFDEFHERSLQADLGLALALEVRELRPDLRLAVMSATLEGERVADLLGGAPFVEGEGRQYPVQTHHRPRPVADRLEPYVAAAVEEALAEGEGDVLVFLPGAGEIRRTRRALEDRGLGNDRSVLLAPLFGALPPRQQDRAIDPAPEGVRKVILSTDIAETSLTIEGVGVVVDSGLTRVPRFDPATGMSRLVTIRCSRASADQRRGRAGRTAPGLCFRLWSRSQHAGLTSHIRPEIEQADLAGFALEAAAWGITDPDDLRLLDPPPPRVWDQAVDLLSDLEALDGGGRITAHGRALVDLPLHPRLAHMVVRADEDGRGALACAVAALLADRDPLSTSWEHPCADLAVRVRLLEGEGGVPRGARVRRGTLHRARQQASRLRRTAGVGDGGVDAEATGAVLALAYPDRVARRRSSGRGRFLLANGRGATLSDRDVLAGEPWLVVAAVDRGEQEARIYLAAAVDRDEFRSVLASRIETVRVVEWDDERADVVAEEQERLGAVVLSRAPLEDPDPDATTAALLAGIRREGLDLLAWSRAATSLRRRVAFLRRALGEGWPAMSDEALLGDLEDWLAPFLTGCRRRADLEDVPLLDALRSRVGWERARRVDDLAPTHVTVPSGARVRLDYSGEHPALPARVQQMFGATTTPRVAGGRVPVTVRLLDPAGRPVAITQDLAGFWRRTYPEVRAEKRGRYPRHPWPEDPLRARPTDRAKTS